LFQSILKERVIKRKRKMKNKTALWLMLIFIGAYIMKHFQEDINYTILSKILDIYTKGKPRELWQALKKTDLPLAKQIWIYLQARHETAGFRRFPDHQYNYFGIKYVNWMSKYGVEKSRPVWTAEYNGEEYIPYKTYFAKFSSPYEALSIYLKLPSVQKALASSNTMKEYFRNLRKYGYYTAPFQDYYTSILKHAKELEKYA